MSASEHAVVMVPAPPLPPPATTPARLPAGEVPGSAPVPARAPATPSVDGRRARMASRASAVHASFLDACGGAQLAYLRAMGDVAARSSGSAAGAPARGSVPMPASIGGPLAASAPDGDAALSEWIELRGDELFVGLDRAPWLGDHRPDYGVAVLPMTGAIEIVAASAQAAAPGRRVVAVRDLSLRAWIVLDDAPQRLHRALERHADGSSATVTLSTWREAARPELSREEPVTRATVELADDWPPAPPDPEPLAAPEPVPDPYEAAELFHGPAFRLLGDLRADAGGASATIDFGGSPAPLGVLHPVALDAALQAGAVKRWGEWCGAEVGAGKCLPVRLVELSLHGPAPRGGTGRLEMRGRGVHGHPRFPILEFSIYAGDTLWARMTVVFVAVPESRLDDFPQRARRAHLRDRARGTGVRVSAVDDGASVLTDEELAAAEWIPRTVRMAYGIEGARDLALAVAMREHAAARFDVHPSEIVIEDGEARCPARPDARLALVGAREGRRVTVRDAG